MFAPRIPLLAAFEVTLPTLFALLSVIVWLWNVFNGKQNAAGAGGRQQPQPGGKNVDQELKAEINRFLKNVMGQKQGPADELQVLEAVEVRQESRSSKKPRSKPATAQRQNLTTPDSAEGSTTLSSARPGGRISQRKGPGSTTLGSAVREHLAEHMQEGLVMQKAQNFLGRAVSDKVQRDLGAFSANDPMNASAGGVRNDPQTATSTGVGMMLRDPAGIKQAFVLNLILNRPSFGKRKV